MYGICFENVFCSGKLHNYAIRDSFPSFVIAIEGLSGRHISMRRTCIHMQKGGHEPQLDILKPLKQNENDRLATLHFS